MAAAILEGWAAGASRSSGRARAPADQTWSAKKRNVDSMTQPRAGVPRAARTTSWKARPTSRNLRRSRGQGAGQNDHSAGGVRRLEWTVGQLTSTDMNSSMLPRETQPAGRDSWRLHRLGEEVTRSAPRTVLRADGV